jgi:hypothetical protein
MSSWQLIFMQSKVNNGAYNGDRLCAANGLASASELARVVLEFRVSLRRPTRKQSENRMGIGEGGITRGWME